MKRLVTTIILAAVLLSLLGCGKAASQTQTAAVPQPSSENAPPVTADAPPPTTLPQTPEGFLYLSVSGITFTLVGEAEDIYIGTAPREDVTWSSADESIITFENGIARAVGVGTTTLCAQRGNERIECTAGCLAQDEAALAALDAKLLRAPKRLPPAAPEGEMTFFDDSVIIGDSITYVLNQYNTKTGVLGKPKFLCRGSASVNGFLRRFLQIYFRGVECNLEDAIAQTGAKKAYFMLGQNDIGYQDPEQLTQRWLELIAMVREKSPDIQIYIQSCSPSWGENGAKSLRNESLDTVNANLKALAQEENFHYLELSAYLEDHENKLATVYCSDQDVHFSQAGTDVWIQLLKAHAHYQTLLASGS